MLALGAASAEDSGAAAETELDAELSAALSAEVGVDGLLEADAETAMMTIAANAMTPLSALCRAGQDRRFRPFGGSGGSGGVTDRCGHDEG